ncbi:protein-glutamine gamma-glutamyltransferase 5-like [Ambystoma mexicanum]|uniref:protein-glutamine gamma-glutamyltransferase 5-like n=1 Tax=Ambystoma mexicanum TaxID=8296 RepID=UPI0037E77CE2
MEEMLEVAFIDLLHQRNKEQHHTDDIGGKRLIVRRGQPFAINLHFKTRGLQPGVDHIAFIVETGPWPEVSSGTKAVFPLAKSGSRNTWCAVSAGQNSTTLVASLSAPGNAIIGCYTLKIQVSTRDRNILYQLGDFYLLFNPWSQDDEVYLGNETQRQEYVLNDYGFVYQGNPRWISPCPWNFGQFEEDIALICLKLLDKTANYHQDAFEDLSHRNDPVYVSRVICAMICCNNDNGVLDGKWGGDCSSGVCPSAWNGSVAILRQWQESGYQPVKYGQCWAFAAVMCTVMRCLGIPTRVITSFDSAHDSSMNLSIEECHDHTGKKLPASKASSIWSFHVWIESWMARKDLPPGYGGWQVLDPTPQEMSNGILCCGPASVKGIKEGDVDLPYGAHFVFAMVNADCISWRVQGPKKEKHFHDTRLVGNSISTKSVGSDHREDVTDNYKYKEGSQQARKVFQKASNMLKPHALRAPTSLQPKSASLPSPQSNGSLSHFVRTQEMSNQQDECPNRSLNEAKLRMQFKLVDFPYIGQTISLKLVAANLAAHSKNLKLSVSAQSMRHDGKPLHQFWTDSLFVSLGPNEEKMVMFKIPYSVYGNFLDENNLIHFVAMGEQNTNWEKLLAEKDVNLAFPDVIISVLGRVIMDQKVTIQVNLVNPLPEVVQDCLLVVEGSGLVHKQLQMSIGAMGPGEQSSITFEIVPFKSGLKQLQVNISSSKFKVMKGYKTIAVNPRKAP